MAIYNFAKSLQDIVTIIISNNSTISSIQPEQPPYISVTDGRHTSNVKLGKFLLKYSFLSEVRVKELVEEYKLLNSNMEAYITNLTTDYVEIYKTPLYALGSSNKSCMTRSTSVSVYGYDDRLSLLTITIKNVLAARTLVRTDTMEYVRLYIDHNIITPSIAIAIVEDREGYTAGDLEGIRLERIEEGDCFVCPYLDGVDKVADRGNYLLITEYGELEASNTNGYTSPLEVRCQCCGDYYSPEDMTYDEDSDREVCISCWEDNHIYFNGSYYSKDECVEVRNGTYIPTDLLSDEGYVYTADGEWEEIDNCVYLERESEWYLFSEVEELALEYNEDRYALKSDVIYNPHDLDSIHPGYYLPEQLEEVITEFETKIATLQTDLFQETEAELEVEEAHNLTIEINLIRELLGDNK